MSVISICPAPGCDKEIHGDSTCCIKHWKQLPRGLREKYVDNPDSYMWKIWFQKAQCVWRGVPKGLISHAVIHADLDAAIASAIEAAEYAKSRRGGLLSCPHATVREIVHLGEPFRQEPTMSDDETLKTGIRPMSTFRENGLLWYVNRVAFHPRGFALALDVNEDTGDIIGWQLWGNGDEPWTFKSEDDDECFKQVEALFAEVRVAAAGSVSSEGTAEEAK